MHKVIVLLISKSTPTFQHLHTIHLYYLKPSTHNTRLAAAEMLGVIWPLTVVRRAFSTNDKLIAGTGSQTHSCYMRSSDETRFLYTDIQKLILSQFNEICALPLKTFYLHYKLMYLSFDRFPTNIYKICQPFSHRIIFSITRFVRYSLS